MAIMFVALGSALGGVARFGISKMLNSGTGVPWGTFAVNVIGSLVIGAISGYLATVSRDWVGSAKAFAVVGFCGGFTTFSTFSNETFRMLENGQWMMLSLYVTGTVAAGLAAVWIGYACAR